MTKGGDTGKDLICGLRPDEGSRVFVVGAHVLLDRMLELSSGAMGAAADLLVGEVGEPPFDHVDPGRAGWREVNVEARMAQQPASHGLSLVGAVVVDDQMDLKGARHAVVDAAEELEELLRAVAPEATADDLPAGHVESREQGCRAVPHVVVGASLDRPRTHRQQRLRAVKGLDLRLLVDAQNDRAVGRRQVEANDVPDLLDELRIRGQLEVLTAVGLKTEGSSRSCGCSIGSCRLPSPSSAGSSASPLSVALPASSSPSALLPDP